MGYIIIKKKGHIRIKIRCINVGVFPQIGVGKEHGVTGGRIHRRRGGSGYLPPVSATCAIGGRIQQRHGGGGGKERGDQRVLPEAGSSGSAVAAALFSL